MYALAILSLVNLILQLVPAPKKAAAPAPPAPPAAKAGKMVDNTLADYVVDAISNLSEKYD